jgi:adenylosuccinate lyase
MDDAIFVWNKGVFMEPIDTTLARQRDSFDLSTPDEMVDWILPDDLRERLSPEDALAVTEFALGWGALAAEAERMEAISPLESRYADPEARLYLSEQTRTGYLACVEGALVQTLAEFGVCSGYIAHQITSACEEVRAQAVAAEEKTTRHDIKALINCISAHVNDEAKPFVHMAATSFDIVSPAEALRYREAVSGLLRPRFHSLLGNLVKLVERYAATPQIGRTHGQQAEPITFGFAIAQSLQRLGESVQIIGQAGQDLKGKFSGAVGAYNASAEIVGDPIAFEDAVLAKLGLEPVPISTQIAPPDDTVRLMNELAVAAGIMADLANDMRQLQRPEIAEAEEAFDREKQTGSSAMPHKRNPITFENVMGLNKVVQALVRIGHDNLISEHQRDLTDYSSSRFYAELFALVAIMAKRLGDAMAKVSIDEAKMVENLQMGGGKIASGLLQTALRKLDHPTAHDEGRRIMAAAEADNITFAMALERDRELAPYLARMDEATLEKLRKPELHYTGLAEEKARGVAAYWRQYLA